jgi:CubicO group peptidase (beta-lactamase class C family)
MANLELGVANTPHTVFDIGSTSKQFTAASIHLLAQEGKLRLEDDIRKYLPEIPAYSNVITIRQLLHHTGGLRDYLTLMELQGSNFEDETGDQEALDIIVRQKAPNFAPGSEYLYSNTGFFLLSVIVKRVSGQTLPEFLQARIFGPLGMVHTHSHDDHTLIVPNRATGYAPRDSGGYRISMSNFEQTGDGAVMTTVEDLIRWDQNFYQPTVGGQALVDAMQTTDTLTGGKPNSYATGLRIGTRRGLRTVRHGGAWAGYRAELLRFPAQHFSVACLCNSENAEPEKLADRVADLYLRDLMQPEPPSVVGDDEEGGTDSSAAMLPLAALQPYTGTYYGDELEVTYTISADSSGLIVRVKSKELTRLKPGKAGEFSDGYIHVVFTRNRKKQISGFVLDAGRVRGILFVRKR